MLHNNFLSVDVWNDIDANIIFAGNKLFLLKFESIIWSLIIPVEPQSIIPRLFFKLQIQITGFLQKQEDAICSRELEFIHQIFARPT